jgi:hypothetical protein
MVLLAVALVPLVAAGCGEEAGEDVASRTATVTETVGETVTETAGPAGTTTGAAAPPAPTGPVVTFQGSGDRTLPPVEALDGGATLAWRNGGEVFSLFSEAGMLADSVEPGGEISLPAGRHVLEIVASGGWRIEIGNARRAR